MTDLKPRHAWATTSAAGLDWKHQQLIEERRDERDREAVNYNPAERAIVILMRLVGVAGSMAVVPVVLPHAWMNTIHESVGLGTLPDLPIVSYLTRSLSTFFALHGGLTLYIASDVRRHRDFVFVWALMFVTLGTVRIGIDAFSGMPLLWTLGEGPPVIVLGLMALVLHRRIE